MSRVAPPVNVRYAGAPAAVSVFRLILTAETQRERGGCAEKSTFILGHYRHFIYAIGDVERIVDVYVSGDFDQLVGVMRYVDLREYA